MNTSQKPSDRRTAARKNPASQTKIPLLTGPKQVLEAILSRPDQMDQIIVQKPVNAERRKIIDLCREKGLRFRTQDKNELDRIFSGNHQGVIARIFSPGYTDLSTALDKAASSVFSVVLALDRIQDPGNVGTLARSLYALGGRTIIVPRHESSFLGDAAMRASAGTLDRLHIVQAVNLGRALDECRKKGFWIYAATLAEKSLPLFQAPLNMPAVIVLGNEDKGVRPKILSRCHALAHVPMLGSLDSLNVAQAGAMFMYELLRRQLADSKK